MSNFILSFFYQIIYMSIIATVIGAVILLIRKVTRRKLSPNASYIICLVFLVALIFPITLPSRVSIYNVIDIEDVKYTRSKNTNFIIEQLEKLEDVNNVEQNMINGTAEKWFEIEKDYTDLTVATIWFIVFLFKLIKKLLSHVAFSKIVGNESIKDERIILILERCKQKLNIKRNIKVIQQDIARTPATIGIFNVKILVTDMIFEFSDMEVSNIFMHELTHYKRKDNIVNFLMLILKSVYWFNPMMEIMFKNIRNDMELATDEIAIGKMDLEEQRVYCKLMVWISAMPSRPTLKKENLLGLANGTKAIEKRIEMISLKENFEKNAKIIAMATIFIILAICLVLYPTSYGRFITPKLYWKLENGEKIELTRIEENLDIAMNEVKLTPDSKVKLIVKEGKSEDYIFYNVMDLDTMEFRQISNMCSKQISYFDNGEYIYKFTIPYGNKQTVNYAIKVIVE